MASQAPDSPEPCIRKGYLIIPFGQLHYAYCDPTAPSTQPALPVLLLHMSASSSQSMYTLMRKLSTLGYPSFAPDMPGFGNSDEPESNPPNIAWYASLYHAAFSALPAFARGCHIMGHHSGAVIGTELANEKRYGSFVRSLTCVGPAVLSAEQRVEMSKTFLEPFNRPDASGHHLIKTWKYLQWEGLSPGSNLALLHREMIDHIRAWKGRTQIYSCVWQYDCAQALLLVPQHVRVLGLCARDDVLWPYFEQFRTVGAGLRGEEIHGGNFGPDLDSDGILRYFVPLINEL
ncbi:alpha/beta-hydrolase [Phaeosphaeriaceae sp. SRC1lsM3a]|nr:alpha/beta-hydrolase [Stagonospora sp. SRC1lsM3a]